MRVTDHCRAVKVAVCLAALLILAGLSTHASGRQDTATAGTGSADSSNAPAMTPVTYDSSAFISRTIPSAEVEAYHEDDAFDYARTVAPSTSFAERMIDWFVRLLDSIFGNEAGRNIFQYGIFGAALILVMVLLMRSELGGVFKRSVMKKGGLEYEEMEEDISGMDFDALIAEAIAAGNLRRAVRLHYLKLLAEMTDRGLIEWRREKTNSEYLNELRRHDLRFRFAELTRVFDFVWYGGFEIDSERYARISGDFNAFTRTVQEAS